MEPFEGHDVIKSGIEMPGAGGGLNKALSVDELEKHHGDRFVVAVEVEVVKVRHDTIKDTQALQRVHVLRVDNATIIESDVVAEALDAQRVKVEEAKGITRLPYEDTDAPDIEDGAEPSEA
jgi:hypothetical protein